MSFNDDRLSNEEWKSGDLENIPNFNMNTLIMNYLVTGKSIKYNFFFLLKFFFLFRGI